MSMHSPPVVWPAIVTDEVVLSSSTGEMGTAGLEATTPAAKKEEEATSARRVAGKRMLRARGGGQERRYIGMDTFVGGCSSKLN